MVKILEDLMSQKKQKENELANIREACRSAALERFSSHGGCNTCRGRGWVVVWDTLDSMTGCYAEYGACPEPNCTQESRANSGLHPSPSKYDRFNSGSTWVPEYTPEQMENIHSLELDISKLKSEICHEEMRWSVSAGKVVKVSKSGRGPKARRVPVGIVGLVKKLHTNDWGTTKAIVVDESGKQWWPKLYQLEVVDPSPDLESWNNLDMQHREKNGFPIVVTVQKKTARAVLVKTTTSREFWIPFSQVPELSKSAKRQTLSVSVPMWIAEKNGLVTLDR